MSSIQSHITLYVDPKWHREGQYSPLMYPFWGNPLTEQTPFQKALFNRYGYDTACYSVTDDPEKADLVFMPFSHNAALRSYPELLPACIQKAKELNKPLLIDGVGDIEHPIDVPNVFILRYGGYRFEKKENEIIIPPYADDLLEIYCGDKLQVRSKSAKPSVGFAGWGKLTFMQQLRSVIKEAPDRLHGMFDSRYRAKKKGVFFRAHAIQLLEASPLVEAKILRRASYSGHANTVGGSAEIIRREFVDNLLGSDYGLDIRGDANASTRLSEMLSLGRIPVIVDTERNLPFSEELDYSAFSLVVDFRDLKQLPQKISQFHAQVSQDRFEAMQRAARDAYVRYFRVDSLMPHILKELDKKGVVSAIKDMSGQ